MFDLQKLIGVKTYSFRNIKDNAECAKAITSCKACTADLSGTHIDYDAADTWAKISSDYQDNGVAITGLGVVRVSPDEAFNRRFFEFAKLANVPLVSITFEPEEWEKSVASIEKLSEEYGIPTAIHNHGGYNWMGNSTILKYIFSKCSKRIGLCLDTAWCIHTESEDPVQWMNLFGDRMYGIHFKDFTWNREGKHIDSIVGEGALDLPATLAKFKEMEHIISAVVEYEGPETVECTRKSIENIRAIY